ncbi:MAG: hypothetical protein ACRDTJ_22500 [Pseudonocardiaceae bacterium]
MAKIRGVKPELWTDEDFTELSPFARLLWVGMWNFACDNGHLQDKSKQIKLRILPTDDVNCADLLREIEGQGLIERVDGWITIPNLTHHQKPHKRWFTTCDHPSCDAPEGSAWGNPKRKTTVAQPLDNGGPRLNNGGATVAQPFDGDVDCEVDGDGEGDGERQPLVDESTEVELNHPDRFDEFWDVYDRKVAKAKAKTAFKAALKKSGVTADLIITSARDFIAWQHSEGKHPEFTPHPATWLHQERWADERASRQPQGIPDMSPNMAAHMALVEQLRQEEADAQNVFPIDRQIGH